MTKVNRIYRIGSVKRRHYQDGFGRAVKDRATLNFIDDLTIPPAWTEVEINLHPNAKIQATGYDTAGRKQYLYNPNYRERQERAKFDRILAFANALPMMRRITGDHLRHRRLDRQKVLACMVRLIDQAYFRVGNEEYVKENKTFGLTTMRSRHLTIEGDRLIFRYVAKSHKEQVKEVVDARLARIVREIDHLPGYEIFKYLDENGQIIDVKSDDLNAYIKEIMGYDFSAKDFRTWAGTLIAAVALAGMETDVSPARAKHNVTAAVEHVAMHLGNTPAIARASYIDPRIIDHYLSGQTIKNYLRRINFYLGNPGSDLLADEEIAVLKLLRRKLRAKQT